MEKTFSIIMPVWNRAVIIKQAIESVLTQTFKDYELLIIDDGSEDNLDEVVQPYLSKHIIYHKIPHDGANAARNFGIKNAEGVFIGYLDSDNRWHPDFLLKMHKALNHWGLRKEAAYCRYNFHKKNPEDETHHFDLIKGHKFNFEELLRGNYIDINTFVHSKQCVEKVGLFDEKLKRLTDWDFIIRVTSRYKPVFVKEALVDYYLNTTPNTITLTEDHQSPNNIIRKRYMKHDRSAFLCHDAIGYKWENVPDEKYVNWREMTWPDGFNTADFTVRGFPYMLQIEPTNICNLSCPFCPAAADKYELNRERRHMRFEEFKSIIDDMQTYLLFVVLWNWGEPFINPELPAMIRYASERGIKVVTSTNAHFLQEKEYVEEILRSGLATLIVAIDSLHEENYKAFRKGGNLTRAISGLKFLLELKKQIKSETLVNMRMVITKHNEHELPQMKNLAQKLRVDKFTVKTVYPTCGLKSNDEMITPNNPEYRRYVYKPGTYERIRIDVPCEKIWHISTILSNGDVVPCCYDFSAEKKVGNVFEKPFREIWNSPAYGELRRIILYEKDSVPICRECTINYKFSEGGFIPEAHDFNVGVKERAIYSAKRFAKVVLPEKVVEIIREQKKTLFI